MVIRIKRREFLSLAATTPLAACGGRSSPTSPSGTPPVSSAPPSNPPPGLPPTAPPAGPAVSLPVLQAETSGGELIVTIANTALQDVGGMARSEGAVGGLHRYVLLARTTGERVVAFNGICTHEGCVINRFATPVFECPCHGSQYDQAGNVLRGPAPAALPALVVTFDGRVARVRF